MDIRKEVRRMKEAAPVMASLTEEKRNQALAAVIDILSEKKDEIFAANNEDLERARESGTADSIIKRLRFDEHKLEDVLEGIRNLISLEDPLGRVTLSRELDEGLNLVRISCPIGVIGIIFEARPDALVQISSLCIKSGNCAVLKGGKETARTNKVLFDLIYGAARAFLPESSLMQVSAHEEIDALLKCDDCVDLLIPRGSNRFVRYIMENTRIPVMGHSDGVCHSYVDEFADLEKSIAVIIDAKTQYTAACNATETLLVHRAVADRFLPMAAAALKDADVRLRADREAADLLGIKDDDNLMKEEDFSTEYLDMILSVHLVSSVEEAAAFINRFGSHHTDAILTENNDNAETFMRLVDSAGVYQNCSTRFADGFRYGFGAEVGISTGKLHARGPVGLDGLVTYKYRLYGHYQTVGDYQEGRRQFHFRDL